MNGGLVVNREQPQFKPVILSLFAILACWVFVFWQGLSTAIDIWLISEIFNHCLFVLPGTAYLIYLKKDQLDLNQLKPNYFVLPLCLGSLLLYAIGLAGDVQLFMHVATFTFLPLVLWVYLGNKLALQILFPLTFILFCIPVGEELIPTLQEVTADLSMVMLNWTGIPIYRSGLYIEIPQGRFLVAEACSGISFFIASIVIGSLYSYLNLRSNTRRIGFMLISIIFPVIANAIRVFGIILTGYLSNMEHAVGADHLIYGWIFFSLVIVCLLAIGELVRENHSNPVINTEKTEPSSKVNVKGCYQASAITIIIMFAFFVWFNSINTQLSLRDTTGHNLKALLMTEQSIPSTNYESTWKPEFNLPYQEFQFLKKLNGIPVDLYIVWYPKGHGELISSLNRLYSQKVWTLESKSSYQLDDNLNIDLSMIVNPHGKRLLSYWYVVDGKVFTNNRMAKLYEIYKILMGSYMGSGLIAISQTTDAVSIEQDKLYFSRLTQDNFVELSQYFDF
ncbi:exosortase A [Paraglaciecola marina]|uniref:exosortase A n=1 Tax=Paraglaciecola marina TaxID=2500157 RepID=UPI00105EAC48|nr:exosortase A [Paraglaciecola marina]